MHSQPTTDRDSDFGEWEPAGHEDPGFRCRGCGGTDVWRRAWGGDDDEIQYECRDCWGIWWAEGGDP